MSSVSGTIKNIDVIKCTGQDPTDCGTCESCVLNSKLEFTCQWFTRLSEHSKQNFIKDLLKSCRSFKMITSLIGILQPLQCKDFIYAKSKASSTFDHEISKISNNVNSAMQPADVMSYVAIDKQWFETATSWTKFNYLLRIFKLCNAFTLDSIKLLLSQAYELERRSTANRSSLYAKQQSKKSRSSFGNAGYTAEEKWLDRRSHSKDLFAVQQYIDMRTPSVTISPSLEERYDSTKYSPYLDESFELCSIPLSKPSKYPARRTQETRLSARCYPYTGQRSDAFDPQHCSSAVDSDIDDYLSFDDLRESTTKSCKTVYHALSTQRDFISRLPVHLSKYILAFLDTISLTNCICVSHHWRTLAEEVSNETLTQQIMREDVMLIQGSTEKIPNPDYARIVPLHVPKLSESNEVIYNDEAKHVDVTCDHNEFDKRNMQSYFEGIETDITDVEERNVYCGAYNVLVLTNSKDNTRVTFYNGGKYVPVASIDRRIRLLDTLSGRCEKTIVEHVGSVKSVYTDESRGFVVSGSYDTSIRLWDIKTGRCQKIFLGHKSSVISLSMRDRYLASGSTDKTCKVWNVKSGKCIRTFRHRNIIQSVAIGDYLLLTGCAGGRVRVWDLKEAKLVKTLDGHMASITCTKFDDNHIVTGSKDCYAMAWSTKGDFKRCLQTFRHPKEVNCLELMYCRIITGSSDGKIRIWNLLTGECLRIVRGNSKNDPITALYASENRLIVNTRSNLLLYNFEVVNWNYSAPPEKASQFVRKPSMTGDHNKVNRAFERAKTLRHKGIELLLKDNVDHSDKICRKVNQTYERTKRVQSAPIRMANAQSIQKHISRVQSAVARMKCMQVASNPLDKKDSTDKIHGILKQTSKQQDNFMDKCKVQSFTNCQPTKNNKLAIERSAMKSIAPLEETSVNAPRVIARSRSAPAYRKRTLPSTQRGFTSSSDIQVKNPNNKLNASTKQETSVSKIRPFSASVSNLQSPAEIYCDLKLKSFYQQLEFENELAQRKI